MKNKSINYILANNIKYYRSLKKCTQEEFAEHCDLSVRYINYIENAGVNTTIKTLDKIAKYLKIEPYQLLMNQENKNKNK